MKGINNNGSKARARFRSLYYGQRVFCSNEASPNKLFKLINPIVDFGWLVLNSISSLTEEQAIEVAKLCYPLSDTLHTVEQGRQIVDAIISNDGYLMKTWELLSIYQYLLSQSIALPFYCPIDKRVISVDEQEELGFIKIRK